MPLFRNERHVSTGLSFGAVFGVGCLAVFVHPHRMSSYLHGQGTTLSPAQSSDTARYSEDDFEDEEGSFGVLSPMSNLSQPEGKVPFVHHPATLTHYSSLRECVPLLSSSHSLFM